MYIVTENRTPEQNENLSILADTHVIELTDLKLVPLSSQLSRITGNSYNAIDFVNEDGKGLSSESNSIIIHISTGLRFLIP